MSLSIALLLSLQFTPLPPVESPGADSSSRDVLRRVCPAHSATRRDQLLSAERAAAEEVRRARARATSQQWGRLACARAHLHLVGALSRESLIMPAGTAWIEGAVHAAQRAVDLEPGATPHAEVLASLLLGLPPIRSDAALAASVIRAVDAGVRAPTVLQLCADMALRQAATADARRCAEFGLAGGNDSTWHLIRLAWLSSRAADSMASVRLIVAAAGAAAESVSRDEVAWHLAWFVEPLELAAWRTVVDSQRGSWVADRLLERDIRDGQAPGSRLVAHFDRLDHVMREFRLVIPAVLRGTARTGSSTFFGFDTLAANRGQLTIFREYGRWQLDFDDRGVVWMRFGAPTAIARNVPSASQRSLETWRYDLDGRHFLVHFTEADFDGSSGTAMLAAGIVGPWQCGIDPERCLAASSAAAQQASLSPSEAELAGVLQPERVQTLRDQDRAALALATTKDDNSQRGLRPIDVVARAYQLWDPRTEAPILVVAYGARLGDLTDEATPDGGSEVQLAAKVRRWDGTRSAWSEDSLPGTFTLRSGQPTRDAYMTAFRSFSGTEGIGAWGVTVSQDSTRWGRAWGRVSATTSGPLALSDLIAAAESRGLSWVLDGERIFLSPGGNHRRSEPLHLQYQVRSEQAGLQTTTTIVLRRLVSGRPDSMAALQIAAEGSHGGGVSTQRRVLDLSRLEPGAYRLEVQVAARGAGHVVRREMDLVLE